MSRSALAALMLIALLPSGGWAFGPPTECRATDTPNDAGGSVTVSWSQPDNALDGIQYEVWLATAEDGPFSLAIVVPGAGAAGPAEGGGGGRETGVAGRYSVEIADYVNAAGWPEQLWNGEIYYFRVDARAEGSTATGAIIVSATPVGNLFDSSKVNNLVLAVAFSAIILFAIQLARTRELYIRRIAGLEAMDEALGRATEMGKAVLFVHGLRDMSNISTIAAVNILGRVARRTAELGTLLRVSNCDPVVMSVSQETVKESYLEVGRPDAYNPDDIFMAGTDQFSYAAAVEGIMVRERPAAHIMMGYFYAEALLLAETGATTGAIQIAGTDAFTQLPFFVTTCDYTLMGEEMYAASAYLSREPKLLGSLKGQDAGKLVLIVVILLGTLLSSLGLPQLAHLFSAH